MRFDVERRATVRAMWLWVLVRLFAALLLGLAGANPITLSLKGSVLVLIIVTIVSFLEIRRHNEDVFLPNLGTSMTAIILLGLSAVIVLEVLVTVIYAA